MCIRIINGGQDGAERGAIDAAIDSGVTHSGSEIADLFPDDSQIERHVLNSNGTVVFYYGKTNGRIANAIRTAVLHGYPCMVVDLSTDSIEGAVLHLSRWIDRNRVTSLYVTGLSAGEDARIYKDTRTVVSKAIERIRCSRNSICP